jgi:membrane fusion protein (multidrug efflux system)
VLVVADDGSVTARPVKLGPSQGGRALVLDGLAAGEKVVVDGLQKVKAGGKARAVPWAPAAATPAPAASR